MHHEDVETIEKIFYEVRDGMPLDTADKIYISNMKLKIRELDEMLAQIMIMAYNNK